MEKAELASKENFLERGGNQGNHTASLLERGGNGYSKGELAIEMGGRLGGWEFEKVHTDTLLE